MPVDVLMRISFRTESDATLGNTAEQNIRGFRPMSAAMSAGGPIPSTTLTAGSFAYCAKGWEAETCFSYSGTSIPKGKGSMFPPLQRTQGWGTLSRGILRPKRAGHPPPVGLLRNPAEASTCRGCRLRSAQLKYFRELELYMKRPNNLITAFANALGCACRGSTR